MRSPPPAVFVRRWQPFLARTSRIELHFTTGKRGAWGDEARWTLVPAHHSRNGESQRRPRTGLGLAPRPHQAFPAGIRRPGRTRPTQPHLSPEPDILRPRPASAEPGWLLRPGARHLPPPSRATGPRPRHRTALWHWRWVSLGRCRDWLRRCPLAPLSARGWRQSWLRCSPRPSLALGPAAARRRPQPTRKGSRAGQPACRRVMLQFDAPSGGN